MSPASCADERRDQCFLPENTVFEKSGLPNTNRATLSSQELSVLPPGDYRVNVRMYDDKGFWNSPFSEFFPPIVTIPEPVN